MGEWMTCEGTVHSVIFQNAENGYTVLRLLTEEGEVITVVGCIPCVAPGEHLAVSGEWETHPQHGEQLKALELERTLPEDEDEILSYLASGICKGVGPATAQRIVDRFGVETLDILEREPERLSLIKGITAKKAQEIADWSKRADFYRDKVLSIMTDLRTVVDEMENLTAEEYWPMPTYGDLLFGVI
jgi:exodeoxyribonuclease V alpha subunit